MSEGKVNTLVVATVLGGQILNLTQALRAAGFGFTEVASQVHLVEQSVTSLLIGLDRDRLDELMTLLRDCCTERLQYVPARLDSAFNTQPLMVEALLGGATIFVFDVEQFIQF